MRRIAGVLLVLLVMGLVPQSLQAQVAYGTILGTVTDESGAVVPNANVTVVNVKTNVANKVQTGREGNYSIGNLFPGEYQVTVEAVGFRSFIAGDLLLDVDQNLRVDAALQPGATTTKVEVTDVAQLVATDSSSIGTVIENAQIVDLPMVSRNFVALTALSPGAINNAPSPTGASVTTLATAEENNRTQLAGGGLFVAGGRNDANSFYIDGLENTDIGFNSPAITPPIDAIQEFSLATQNYTAEFGGSQAQVHIATKSGTNAFHGVAYDFLRNDVLNACLPFCTLNLITQRIKPQLRWNEFGGSLGGPIKRDKWFFFGNYEGLRSHVFSAGTARVPTVAELGGNFSAELPTPIYDPTTGQPFPGNIIPPGRISTLIQPLFSMPLFVAPNVSGLPGGANYEAYLVSPDTINQTTSRVDGKLSDRDSLFVRGNTQRENLTVPSPLPLGSTIWVQNGDNVTLGYDHLFSPRLVNEFRMGWLRPYFTENQQSDGKPYAQTLFPNLSNQPALYGTPAISLSNYAGFGDNGVDPLLYAGNQWTFADTVTWVRGTHTIKAGLDVHRILYKFINSSGFRGSIGFDGIFTAGALNKSGDAAADFLLALPDNITFTTGIVGNWQLGSAINPFIQDDWKVSRRLTLNLGLRYENREPFVEQLNRKGGINLNYPGGGLCSPNLPLVQQFNTPYFTSCPRGIYNRDNLDFAPRFGFAYRPFSNTFVVRGGYGIFYGDFQQNEQSFNFAVPPFRVSENNSYYPASPPPAFNQLIPRVLLPVPAPPSSPLGEDRNLKTLYAEQWNLDLQKQLRSNWALDLGYIGDHGSRLNQRVALAQGELISPGEILHPYYNFTSALMDMSASKSNYDALTARVEKRFNNGFYFESFYTWSKTLAIGQDTTTVAQNYYDRNADYGPITYDVPQRVVFSGIYELPFGHGKRFGSSLSGLADKLARGWQANGLYQIQSGFPFTVAAIDVSGTGAYHSSRANLVGNPQAPDSTNPTLAFNRSAFAVPAAGTFGNSGVGILQGKGINNLDFSLFKNTYVSERINVQFRAEAFNLWNHPQLGPFPGLNVSSPATFAEYTTIGHASRIVMLALKIIF